MVARQKGRCALCRRGMRGFDAAYCFGAYEGTLRELIHLFKYDRMKPLAPTLGELLAGALPLKERFDELCELFRHVRSEAPADAIVMGSGRIDGRPVMVAAEDFTVKAGTISQAANSKRYRVAEIALLDRVPLVMMLDGAGFRADGKPHARTPTDPGTSLGRSGTSERRARPASAAASPR